MNLPLLQMQDKKQGLKKNLKMSNTVTFILNLIKIDGDMKNFESPTIVKSLGYQSPFNVENRIAQRMDQTISNRQAYDLVYPSHREYYNDKRFIAFDRHFDQVEGYLLKEFKTAMDSAVNYNSSKKLEHVEDFDKHQINLKGIDFSNAPFVTKEGVRTSIKYDSLNTNDPNIRVTSSDPYNTIFGGYIK
jgi:hypothetical protein